MSSCSISKKPLKLPLRRFKRAERGLMRFGFSFKKSAGARGSATPQGLEGLEGGFKGLKGLQGLKERLQGLEGGLEGRKGGLQALEGGL